MAPRASPAEPPRPAPPGPSPGRRRPVARSGPTGRLRPIRPNRPARFRRAGPRRGLKRCAGLRAARAGWAGRQARSRRPSRASESCALNSAGSPPNRRGLAGGRRPGRGIDVPRARGVAGRFHPGRRTNARAATDWAAPAVGVRRSPSAARRNGRSELPAAALRAFGPGPANATTAAHGPALPRLAEGAAWFRGLAARRHRSLARCRCAGYRDRRGPQQEPAQRMPRHGPGPDPGVASAASVRSDIRRGDAEDDNYNYQIPVACNAIRSRSLLCDSDHSIGSGPNQRWDSRHQMNKDEFRFQRIL